MMTCDPSQRLIGYSKTKLKPGGSMIETKLTRRVAIATLSSWAAAWAVPAVAQSGPAVHIIKDPDCGCCTAWARILQSEGFMVTVEHRSWEALVQHKIESGISEEMASCHTAHVESYVIEGHVPHADIRRLLAERPDAVGLAVPGMPMGSPGMGPENEREAYDVFLIRKDGGTEVFASYAAA
jgi:hypothetical protein